MNELSKRLEKTKEKLDSVGCGFCLAKWTQVTMHLGVGMTHSCHHPAPHKIPIHEVKENPSALHNTLHKKRKRREMLSDKKPTECGYCWNVEKTSDSYSDRIFKSNEPWSRDQFDIIKNIDWDENYNPRYVEVSFSNTCNLKCAYCGPQFSSKWVEEVEEYGPYDVMGGYNSIEYLKEINMMPLKHSDENPYLDAFWKWWPDMFHDLHTFRITGGEPLLSKDTFKILEYIQENWMYNPNLSLAINTNLSVPKPLIDKLITICKDLTDNNKVRELIIFTSLDGAGEQAEYIRYGLDYEEIWDNIDNILKQLPKVTINIMSAFNILSIFSYNDLIDKVYEYKMKYHNDERYWGVAIMLDTSYITWPNHLSINILEEEHKELILESAKKMLYYGQCLHTKQNYGFSDIQIQKLKRCYDYTKSNDGQNIEQMRKEFVKFIIEYDKRKGTDFLKTFPQLKDFYVKYKK